VFFVAKEKKGEYTIKKGTIAIVMLVIALISCIATVVAYNVTMKIDIEHLEEEINSNNIDERMNYCEQNLVKNQERIIAMHDDIKEIKIDIKGLIAQ